MAGQTVACRFVYGLSTRLQRHSGANVGFAADKKELELWLAEVVRRLKYQPGIAEHDRDILAEVCRRRMIMILMHHITSRKRVE